MSAELSYQEVLVRAIAVIDGLPRSPRDCIHLGRVSCNSAGWFSVWSGPVPAKGGEGLNVVGADGVSDGFWPPFGIMEVSLAKLLSKVRFALAGLHIEFIVGVPEVQNVYQLEGVADVVLFEVGEKGGFEVVAVVDVLTY